MHPLIYAAPISKADYLVGDSRGVCLNALILLAVPLGILAALSCLAWNPSLLLRSPAVYLSSYGVLVVADRLHLHGGTVLVGGAETPKPSSATGQCAFSSRFLSWLPCLSTFCRCRRSAGC